MPEDPPWRLISPRDAVASRFPFTWLEGGAPSGWRSLDINNNSFDMYSKEQLTNSLVHECNVCKHLFTKLSGEGYEYRPTPGQRSSVELLRYLAVIGIASITGFAESNWEAWRPFAAEVENMTAEEFPAAMDRQIERIRGVMAGLTDEQLATQEAKLPNGTVTNLGAAIIAARQRIVEGAVGMVEMALDQLSAKHVVELDEERKASMVSNLLVVLCSDRDAQPIVNTGTLYQ